MPLFGEKFGPAENLYRTKKLHIINETCHCTNDKFIKTLQKKKTFH